MKERDVVLSEIAIDTAEKIREISLRNNKTWVDIPDILPVIMKALREAEIKGRLHMLRKQKIKLV